MIARPTATAPPDWAIKLALDSATHSPCRSKRGVVLFSPQGAVRGTGFNGPPDDCPGRAICAGTCGQRSVHAETRAIRDALGLGYMTRYGRPPLDLVHVELGADGDVLSCHGPSCWQCSREILDVGFVAGVWLYEGESVEAYGARLSDDPQLVLAQPPPPSPRWRRYTAAQFHAATLAACGVRS